MMRLDRLYAQLKDRLLADGQDDAEASLRILFEDILHVTTAKRLTHPELEVDERLIQPAVDRLLAGEPLAYILGYTEFMGLRFQCAPGVLVPRPETELLVSWALEDQKNRNVHFLDIGTGIGVDLSDTALQVAEANRKALKIDSVRFLHSDLTQSVRNKQFDVILSNPPYITAADMEKLDQRVLHEPRLALYGGTDGLDIYRRIAAETPAILNNGGALYLEIGYDQGETVPQILAEAGFPDITVQKDLSGLDRCVKGYYYV